MPVAFGNRLARLGEAFGDELSREVDVGALVENDGDRRQTELGQASHFCEVRESAHHGFDRKCDELLHFEGPERRGSGQDLHLHVGDVGYRVHRQLLSCPKAERSHQQHAEDDDRPVSYGEIDETFDHGSPSVLVVAFGELAAQQLRFQRERAGYDHLVAFGQPVANFDLAARTRP